MAAKQLVFSEDARRKLQDGMDVLATSRHGHAEIAQC